MKSDKMRKIALSLSANRDNYMESFRKNIDRYIDEKVFTVRELSEKADIPFSTLSSFLYGDATDCKLSTAVRLARACGVSIDELVGADTIEPETRECVALARSLKDHHRYVIRTFVRHQHAMHGEVPTKSKQITVLTPECRNGYLKTTIAAEALNVDHLASSIRTKACLGIRIPCMHYEPHFLKDEIVLLGADREGMNGEKCVIGHGGNIYICIKKIEHKNGETIIKYLSIIDGKNVLFTRDEIDDKYGYVIGFLYPDGTWGDR